MYLSMNCGYFFLNKKKMLKLSFVKACIHHLSISKTIDSFNDALRYRPAYMMQIVWHIVRKSVYENCHLHRYRLSGLKYKKSFLFNLPWGLLKKSSEVLPFSSASTYLSCKFTEAYWGHTYVYKVKPLKINAIKTISASHIIV